jgi:hypothetical protein
VQQELFVFRIGPLDVGGTPMFWYVTHPNTGRAFFNEDDAAALAEIAELYPDRALSCEPSLQPAAQELGCRVRPPTPFEIGARATLWVGAEFPESWRGLDPVATEYILEYASRLLQRQPAGELIIELTVSARGDASALHIDDTVHVTWAVGNGIFAFDSSSSLREFQQSVMDGDLERARSISSLQLEWRPGSAGLQQAFREAYGVDLVPICARASGGERVPLDARDAWLLASILVALVAWIEAGSEAAQGRLDLTPDVPVEVDVEARFLRVLASGGDGSISELGWAELSRRLPS